MIVTKDNLLTLIPFDFGVNICLKGGEVYQILFTNRNGVVEFMNSLSNVLSFYVSRSNRLVAKKIKQKNIDKQVVPCYAANNLSQ